MIPWLTGLAMIIAGFSRRVYKHINHNISSCVLLFIIATLPLFAMAGQRGYSPVGPTQLDRDLFMIHRLFDGAHVFDCKGERVTENNCQKVIADSAILDALNDYNLWDSAKPRKRLKDTLPKIRKIFKCVKNGCDQYSEVSPYIRQQVMLGSGEALDYLSCILKIDIKSFKKQKSESYYYYRQNFNSINKDFYKKSNVKYLRKIRMPTNISYLYLFLRNDQFKECKHLKIKDFSLKFLYRMSPIFIPNLY